MRKIICLILLTLRALAGFAQEPLSGKVLDENSAALPGANVIAYGAGGKAVSYAITDPDGAFSLKKTAGMEQLTVSFLGYKTVSLPAGQVRDGLQVRMEPGGFQLREVAVTAERIREQGDTLSYSVAGFKQAQDRSIADVIRKMPGLEVKPGGAIEYQGKPISNFYIEGMDLMGSQYAMASENLSADKIKEVQVLENHQAVKSLRGVSFSEQAALNLVLKDDAKSTWTGLLDLAGGYGDAGLYDNRLMGMQFNKFFQTLMLYKNDDTGKDIGAEVKDLADLAGYQSESGLLDMPHLDGPAFDPQRYTFNASHLLAGNWLLKTGADSQLRLQASGFLDREQQRSFSRTSYLTVAGMPIVTEDWDVTGRRSEVKGEIDFTRNGDRTYLNSRTKLYADRNASTGRMNLNGSATNLMVRPWKRSLSEDFQLSHTTQDGHVWHVSSSNGFTWLPGRLLTLDGTRQDLDLGLFSSKSYVSLQHRTGHWTLSGKVGLDARHQQAGTHRWSLLAPYAEPLFRFQQGAHDLDATLRVKYLRQVLDGKSRQEICIEPTFRWNWKLSPKSTLLAYYRFLTNPVPGLRSIGEPLYTSYRSQYAGTGVPAVQRSHAFTGHYTYRNPVSGFFASIAPTYVRSQDNFLYASTLDNGILLQQATGQLYDSDTYRIDGRVSRSFSWARTYLGLSGSATASSYSYLAGGQAMGAWTTTYAASFDYSLRPAKWISLEGDSRFTRMRRSAREAETAGITDWEHRLKMNILPVRGWMLSLFNEVYHSSEKDFGINWFCDASLSYKAKRWELSLVGRNLAGTAQYERIRVSSTLQTYTMTLLRPRELLLRFQWDL